MSSPHPSPSHCQPSGLSPGKSPSVSPDLSAGFDVPGVETSGVETSGVETLADGDHSSAASISDALDHAVAQLQSAAGRIHLTNPTGETALSSDINRAANHGLPVRERFAGQAAIAGQNPTDAKATLDLIESMCGSEDRRAAVENLVRAIAPPGTSSVVRAGLGRATLKQLYDSRLGWIGSGSALFDQFASTWAGRPSRNTDSLTPDSEIQTLMLRQTRGIDDEDGTGHSDQAAASNADSGAMQCQIWVHDDPAAIRWLQPVRETLATVLFSRPTRRFTFLSSDWIYSAKAKAWLVAAILIVITAMAWPARYPVSANVTVQTLSGRYVAVPFDGRLQEVRVKPGQHVVAGQPLFELDGRPLRIELEMLGTQWQQAVQEHNVALASHRIADAQQAMLEQKKNQRKIDLVQDRLGRLLVTSPIDGVVLSGDLERMVGSPLELGQTLIEVAAMDSVALELEFPEHEIGFVKPGMDARIKIDALGGQSRNETLDEIYPAAELRDDQNVFVGRVEVANPDGKLRPGMKGKAVAYGPVRPWIWHWLRGTFERTLWTLGF